MSTNSTFSGLELDTLLKKAEQIHSGQNGWTKLASATEARIDINTMVSPGNFSIDYWMNGPQALNSYVGSGPLSLINYSDGQVVRQYVFFFGVTFDGWVREYNPSTKTFGTWKLASKNDFVGVGNSAPENPVNNQVWVDTSSSTPIFRQYDEVSNTWKCVLPGDVLTGSIYDSTGKKQDFFKFIDDEIAKVSSSGNNSDSVDYASHIEDTTRHVTEEEIAGWNAKVTQSGLLSKITNLKSDLESEVVSQTEDETGPAIQLNEDLSNLYQTLESHIADQSIHLRSPNMIVMTRKTGVNNEAHPLGHVAAVYWDPSGNTESPYYKIVHTKDMGLCFYKSSDGINYTSYTASISNPPAYNQTIDMRMFVVNDICFLCLANGYTYRSTNMTNWTKTTALAGKVVSITGVPGRFYAAIQNDGVYASENATSWTKIYDQANYGDWQLCIGHNGIWGQGDFIELYIPANAGIYVASISGYSTITANYAQEYTGTPTYVNYKGITLIIGPSGVLKWNSTERKFKAITEDIGRASGPYCDRFFAVSDTILAGFIIDNSAKDTTLVWTSNLVQWNEQPLVGLQYYGTIVYARTIQKVPDGFHCVLPVGSAFITEFTSTKQYLNQKAEADHTHHKDGSVKLSAAFVAGVIPLECIPDDLKDITIKVKTHAQMLQLGPNDIQNGDWVYVTDDQALFLVTDERYLMSDDAFTQFSTSAAAMDWNSFTGIPTTVEGLGITDIKTNDGIDADASEITSSLDTITNYLTAGIIPYTVTLLTQSNIYSVVKSASTVAQATYLANVLLSKDV